MIVRLHILVFSLYFHITCSSLFLLRPFLLSVLSAPHFTNVFYLFYNSSFVLLFLTQCSTQSISIFPLCTSDHNISFIALPYFDFIPVFCFFTSLSALALLFLHLHIRAACNEIEKNKMRRTNSNTMPQSWNKTNVFSLCGLVI